MTKILLAGCGKMGAAMLEGWLDQGVAGADVVVVDPAAATHDAFGGRVAVVGRAEDVDPAFRPDVVVLAVKPQVMAEVAPAYRRFADSSAGGAVFLSIAAGKTLAFFAGLLGEAAIVRAMPNTPAAVRRGMTVAVANDAVSDAQRGLCDGLLAAIGQVAWVEEEGLIDAVTAVSGSGPAYVFLMAEALAQAGREAGLPDELAAALARATVSGSGELLRQSAESAAALRQNVTSPGGTTAAALAVLMADDGLQPLMTRAVQAAAARSRELAG